MSIQELMDKFLVECGRIDFGNALPPIRLCVAVIKTNAAKLTRIREHQRALPLKQNKVVIFAWAVIC
jgi:hypothetical protein